MKVKIIFESVFVVVWCALWSVLFGVLIWVELEKTEYNNNPYFYLIGFTALTLFMLMDYLNNAISHQGSRSEQ